MPPAGRGSNGGSIRIARTPGSSSRSCSLRNNRSGKHPGTGAATAQGLEMPAAIDNDHGPGRRDKVGRAGQNCHRDVVRFDYSAQRRQVGCFLQGGEISPGYEIGITQRAKPR
jgi:hypothetical protein